MFSSPKSKGTRAKVTLMSFKMSLFTAARLRFRFLGNDGDSTASKAVATLMVQAGTGPNDKTEKINYWIK